MAMSVATELRSPGKLGSDARAILRPSGNIVRVSEESKRKKDGSGLKKPEKPKRLVSQISHAVVRNDVSLDSSCSSDSSFIGSSVKISSSKRRVKNRSVKPAKIVPHGVEAMTPSSLVPGPVKRCDWITPYSDLIYTSFHDEEWGVPVHDDRKLFELLVLSQALAELTWPAILNKRDTFRKLFDNFDPRSVANLSEKKLLTLRSNGSTLLSEPKLRAIVENAKQLLKIQQEFDSFSNYCWQFVNHKPVRNGFRYARQVPAKTPKSELISKDLMQRGFRCVGPTVVYSFMQVAGMVNDHLLTCFRYEECHNHLKEDFKSKVGQTEVLTKAVESTSLV